MSFERVRWSALILLGLLVVGVAYCQIRSATITGTVTDASGAVVPGVAVVVTSAETGISNETKTTDAGQFTVPYLPAGTYTVTVSTTGFAPYRETGLVLATAQTARVNVRLQVAAIGTTVEVQAQATQIQTDSSTVQGSIPSHVIDLIPNPTSNPLYYAFLQAGVIPRSVDTQNINSFGIGVAGRTQWSAVGINGGRASTNDFQLDGLPVMGGGYNEISVTPNTEGLEEVRVISNNFSAQYGRGQGVITMSTKSGTSAYHGDASYSIRNEALMANTMGNKANYSAQQPLGVPRPPFKVHEFGGSMGGPILKNKLFFFASYHYLRFNRGNTSLSTVPTELEAVGNFSQTLTRNEAGVGVASHIFDPWNVVQLGPDLYQRIEVPNADLSGRPDSKYAKKWFEFYPKPNRTPNDEYNAQNYSALVVQTLRRHNLNNRLDYRLGSHSLYGSFGLTKSDNITPRPYGKAPLNDQPSLTTDKNPFVQIGDTIVLSPTVVVDMRYGISRIQSRTWSGNKDGFTSALYDEFGVPQNIRQFFANFGAAPSLPMASSIFGNKFEHQAGHSGNGSLTVIRGTWTHKFGAEYRDLKSNYTDFEEASTAYTSPWFGNETGNYNFQYVTATGLSSSLNTTNIQRGLTNARYFLAAPGWWVRPGAGVAVAFSQKYGALYTQNDWRATNKLTVNLGLRWDVQPGPTERYNRMSGVDLTKNNFFGYPGATAFPGVGGYSRNLWNTRYKDFGPRFGAAYQLNTSTVLRGGLGVTYLPSNSGFWASPVDYGASSFSGGTTFQPYGANPNGVPVHKMYEPAFLSYPTGSDPSAPGLYGLSEAKFDRFYKNGRAMQYNFFIEKRFRGSWFASIGYSASRSDDLIFRNWPINSVQTIPSDLRASWAASYIASNLTVNPATQQIPNPYQPTDGPRRAFQGSLGAATLARQATYYQYPLLQGTFINRTQGWSRYHSMQLRATHSFSRGFYIDLNYTWGKGLNNTSPTTDGGDPGGNDFLNLKNNVHLDSYDIKHRLNAVFLADLPLGSGRLVDVDNPVFRAVLGGWQVGGTLIMQTGTPFFISGVSNGALIARAERIPGVPLEVPKELQRWYDGNTSVTLPNGRIIKPSRNTFLKYYSGAFQGRYVTLPNGKYGYDQNWVSHGSTAWNEMRGNGRINLDLSLRRTVKLRERISLEVSAEASNALNNTQLSGNYSGGLGNTTTTPNPAIGLKAGMGASDTFGTRGTGTYGSREIVMNARIRF